MNFRLNHGNWIHAEASRIQRNKNEKGTLTRSQHSSTQLLSSNWRPYQPATCLYLWHRKYMWHCALSLLPKSRKLPTRLPPINQFVWSLFIDVLISSQQFELDVILISRVKTSATLTITLATRLTWLRRSSSNKTELLVGQSGVKSEIYR